MEDIVFTSLDDNQYEIFKEILYTTFRFSKITLNMKEFTIELKKQINARGFNIESAISPP